MVDTIAELEGGGIREFRGDHSSYLERKEQIAAVAEATAKNQERKLRAQRRFIERFRYKASKARQVQSRIKMLEKMEPEAPSPETRRTLEFDFPAPERAGRVVYEISDFSKEYEVPGGTRNVVFRNCPALRVERGDRVAVTGKNGRRENHSLQDGCRRGGFLRPKPPRPQRNLGLLRAEPGRDA